MEFRTLKPEEIKVRIGNITQFGASLVMYVEARTIMDILDGTVGAENWESDYKDVKGVLYGGIGIYSEKKENNIWKWDCGTESFSEKEKGESSDAFKRAAVKWGISRELYKGPKVSVKVATQSRQDGKGYQIADKKDNSKLSNAYVSDIAYDENRNIVKLIIMTRYWDADNKVWQEETLFTHPKNAQAAQKVTPKPAQIEKDNSINNNEKPQPINKGGIDYLNTLVKETSSNLEKMLKFYKVEKIEDLTMDQFREASKMMEAKLQKTA